MRLSLAFCAVVLVVGCRTSDPHAPKPTPRERDVALAAEKDFGCSRTEITVTPAGPELYEAKGCGKEGLYAVKCPPADGQRGASCDVHQVELDSDEVGE